jgi:SAM-dependent methyltransferase
MFETISNCPLCDSGEIIIVHNDIQDYLCHYSGNFQISECLECDHVFLSKRPVEKYIGKYYEQGYYTHSKPNQYIVFLKKILQYFHITSKPSLDLFGNGKVLDVGCGNGSFLLPWIDKKWEVYGVDIDNKAINFARKNLPEGNFYTGDITSSHISSLTFSYINLSHVLEHIYDVNRFIAALLPVSNPDTTIQISVPRYNCLESRVFGKYWRGLEPPRHIHHFTIVSLIKLMEKNGYKMIMRKNQSLPMCFVESVSHVLKDKGYFDLDRHHRIKSTLYFLVYFPHKISSYFFKSNSMTVSFQKNHD